MEQLNQPYYAGADVGSPISRRSPSPAAGIPGRPRKGAPAHLLWPGAREIHRTQAPPAGFRFRASKTPRGPIRASTPEATAVDLVGYCHRVGGLDQVATVLLELAEQIDPQKLLTAAQSAPITWAQRLGYLLDFAGAHEPTRHLRVYVKAKARQTVPLLPGIIRKETQRDANWKILVNVDIEPDL